MTSDAHTPSPACPCGGTAEPRPLPLSYDPDAVYATCPECHTSGPPMATWRAALVQWRFAAERMGQLRAEWAAGGRHD